MNLNFLKDNSNQLVLFDMDGVLAEYIVGEGALIINEVPGGVYLNKRPLKSIISIAQMLYQKNNITVGILSSCEYPSQVKEKKEWLMKYVPFMDNANIHIIVWAGEHYTSETRKYAKLHFIKQIQGYDEIFLIEDTHDIINAINKELPGTAHHISELIY